MKVDCLYGTIIIIDVMNLKENRRNTGGVGEREGRKSINKLLIH